MKSRTIKIMGVALLQSAALIIMAYMAVAQPSAAWDFKFNGQGDYSDRYRCIATDASGNIYVAGSTVNINTDRDFLIRKLDASSIQVWQVQWNGSGNGPDEVQAIAVDASNNIY